MPWYDTRCDEAERLLARLSCTHALAPSEYQFLLEVFCAGEESGALRSRLLQAAATPALALTRKQFGNEIYLRGLIEFSNYCKNGCYYCGLRADHREIHRYRLTKEDILSCCRTGYGLGFRTFVLQGGEDPFFSPEALAEIASAIKSEFPDCALTYSVGERSRQVYALWRRAGVDRYLLRHETADPEHYRALHPDSMSFENRLRCLSDLKDLGYQVGCGFMVGSPGQSPRTLAQDLTLIQNLSPEMVGIGPFVPCDGTPLGNRPSGSITLTLFCISLLRLILPKGLLPATTALGTLDPEGREKGILAGANVFMPNLSPKEVRGDYLLYNKKSCTGDEAAENVSSLARRMKGIGCCLSSSRGDHPDFINS